MGDVRGDSIRRLRQRWAKDLSQFHSFFKYSRNRTCFQSCMSPETLCG